LLAFALLIAGLFVTGYVLGREADLPQLELRR